MDCGTAGVLKDVEGVSVLAEEASAGKGVAPVAGHEDCFDCDSAGLELALGKLGADALAKSELSEELFDGGFWCATDEVLLVEAPKRLPKLESEDDAGC